MASIPLPALAVKTDQQNPMDTYAKGVALQGLLANQQQQQQMRPLQLQEAQNTVTNQNQAIKDRQATTDAMLGWDGKSIEALTGSVLHKGGSSDAALGLSQHFLKIRQDTAQAAANEGKAAVDKAQAQKLQSDQMAGQFNALAGLPDEQIGPAVLSTAQQMQQAGTIDQQHLQVAQAISQMPPAQAKAALKGLANSFLGASEQIELGLKDAQTKDALAKAENAAKNKTEPQLALEAAQGDESAKKALEILAAQKRAGRSITNITPAQALADEKQGLKWVSWTDKDGRTVAGPYSVAKAAGATDASEVPGQEVRDIQNARSTYHIMTKVGDASKPETNGTLQLIDALDKDGKLGVLASRYNKWLSTGVGTEPGDDPRIITLIDKNMLGQTGAMLTHFGAAGGRSPQMLQHFEDLANAGKMDAATLRAGTKAIADYMMDKGQMPSSSGKSPTASSNSGTTQQFTDGGKVYHIPPELVSEFKKDHPNAR